MDCPQVLILGQDPNLLRPVGAALQGFKNVHQQIAWRAMWYRRLLWLAKTLSVPEINSLRNFLNRKICYDYGPCSTFRDYV
jgi:hypothetical protein